MDYCLMGKIDEKAQPILVVNERDTRMMCSMLVGEKGAVDEHAIKRIIAFIKELGYELAKIVLKSDQESSVKSVIDAVIRARRDAPTMPEYSTVRSFGSNGVIERGMKEVQGQLRAMKSALDARVGVDIKGTSKNSQGWLNMPRCSSTGTSWRRTAKPRMNASVGSPTHLVLNSARASIFGGFPCKADSESSTANGRREQRASLQDEDDEENS